MYCNFKCECWNDIVWDEEVGEEERKDGNLESRKDEKKKERKDEDRE